MQLRLKPEQVDELVAAYRAGGTIKGLAKEYGIHHTTVMRHLDRRGVVDRRGRCR
jgi:DNA-binding MarR family transcriptional regulator